MRVRIINEKIYQLIGMAQRAGKLGSGSYAVEECIRRKNAKLVIISEEASANTQKKFSDICKHGNVNMIVMGSKEDLGKSVGKPERTVLAITDIGFKDIILRALPAATANMGVIDEWQN